MELSVFVIITAIMLYEAHEKFTEAGNVLLSTDPFDPVDGSGIIFTCTLNLSQNDIVSQLWWRFGTSLTNARKIARWDYFEGIGHFSPYNTTAYQMSYDRNKSKLAINPVQLHDEGTYWCELVLGVGHDVDKTSIYVTVPVDSCNITEHGTDVTLITITDGQSSDVTCTATRAKPAVDIWWYHRTQHGSEYRIITGVSQSNTSNGDGTFDTVSILQYIAIKEYNKGQLRCVTTGQDVAPSKEDVVTLNIQYHPNVLAKYEDSTVFCISDANPEVNQYIIVVSSTDHEYGIIPMCKGNNCSFVHKVEIGTRVWCNATNKIGSGNAETDIGAFKVATVDPISAILSTTTWKTQEKASCRVSGWTVAGVTIGIVVLIGLIVLILICIFLMRARKGHMKNNSTVKDDELKAPQPYMALDLTSREKEGAYAEPHSYMKLESETQENEDVYEQPKTSKGLETEGQNTVNPGLDTQDAPPLLPKPRPETYTMLNPGTREKEEAYQEPFQGQEMKLMIKTTKYEELITIGKPVLMKEIGEGISKNLEKSDTTAEKRNIPVYLELE
ncbi:uncharacterized protein [Amphiura filiformis]|uniref:uncharacterized protein isoform X2 n=1 Tax=Amphiura filiformis TaxID=82378 RepID=UPI003B2132F7